MRTSPTHYVNPSAIAITPNANNSYNDLAVYIAPNTTIKVYCPKLGIGIVDNDNYSTWQLTGRNRRLADNAQKYSDTRLYTIYARLDKNGKKGYLVFTPKQQYDGEWYDKYSYITKDGLSISFVEGIDGRTPAAVDDPTYWYVKIGEVTKADNTKQRSVNLDTGILGTEGWNTEWALNPDALPLRIEMNYLLGNIVGEEWAADVRYVRWGQILHVNAKLTEGWTGTDITRFHHWEITRNTGSDADNTWNAAHDGKDGDDNYTSTEFDLALVHTRGSGDDFNGKFSAIFTFTAHEKNPDYISGSELPQYIPLISSTFSVMAEPVESYELEVSSETVTYNPQTGEYVPAIAHDEQGRYADKSGVTVRVRAKDADGNTFYPTDEQIKAIDLHVYYQPIDSTGAPTLLTLNNGSDTLPSAPFLAGKSVEVWLQVGAWDSETPANNIILSQKTITYIRFGAKGDTPINCYRWYKEGLTPKKPTATDSDEPAPAPGEDTGQDSVLPTAKWSATIPDRPATGEWLLWMCSSIRHGDNTRDAWSGPVCISGTKGEPGADAEDREYIYKRLNTYPFSGTAPASINTGTIPDPDNPSQRISSNDKTKNDWVPDGWSDTAMPATSSEKYVYISIRIKEPGQQWGAFSAPVLWTNWGVQGADGDGVQYLYKLFNHELSDDERNNLKPSGATFDDDTKEWKCDGWDDDPLAPKEDKPFCYCSVIQRINGSWGLFGKLGLWSKWAKDGESITKQNEEYRYAVTNDTVQPTQDGSPTEQTEPGKWYENKDRVLPLWSAGRYFWTKTIITWSDGSKTNLYSSERNPNDGKAGQDIIVDGATVMKYYVSENNAQHPAEDDSKWKDYAQITLEKGKWLWSKATTNYKKADGSGSAGYSVNYNVSYIGTDGTDAQYIYLKGTARDINSDVLTTIPCEIKTNGGDSLLTTIQRGLNLVTINRQTLAKVEEAHYDTYGEAVGSQQAFNLGITKLIERLDSLDDSVFVCLVSFDAIGWQRPADVTAGTYPLITALQGYGMSDLPYTATGRYPFLFIGYKNLGKGNGLTRMRNLGAYTDVAELSVYVANGALTIKDGKDGRSIVRITEYYKASAKASGETAPSDDSGWSTNPNTAMRNWNEANKYLWNYEKVEYSSAPLVERTTPQVLAIWTKDGAAGKGIDSITNYYKVTDSNVAPSRPQTDDAGGWTTTPQAPGQGQYLWNYEKITWLNPAGTTYTDVQQIGYAGTDGQDGTSPVFADIDNEMDSVACDKDGFVVSVQDVKTHLRMFKGDALMTGLSITSIAREGTEDVFTAEEYGGDTWDECSDMSSLKIKVSYDDNVATIIFRFLKDEGESVNNVEHFTINASAEGESKQLTFTVNGVRPGADGTNAVLYSLNPSASEIVKKKNGGTEPNSNITCSVIKTDGNSRTAVTTGFVLKTYVDGTEKQSSTVNPANVNTGIVYELYVPNMSGVLVDKETIPVVTDGTDGKDADVWTIGTDGYWYKNGTKTNTKAEGKDGTGIELKGSVDVVLNTEIVGTQTSLEGLRGMSYGDCYMVKSNGWLYFYDGTTPASAGTSTKPANPVGWNPVGEIKGEPGDNGITYYYHTAFADSITLDANGNVTAQSGFTTVNDGTVGYAWVGFCSTNSEVDPGRDASTAAEKLAAAQQYKWNYQKGEDAIVYKIVFTDPTFALDPNTGKNVVSIKGVVYKNDTKITNITAADFAMRFVKSDGTVRELSSGSEFGIQDGQFVTAFGNGDKTLDGYKTFVVDYKPAGTVLTQNSLALTVYGEKGMDAISGYADYLYDADDTGSMPPPSAEEVGKINLKEYSGSNQNRIEICERSGSSYIWKGYGESTYPNGTMFVCKVDNHIYRASANGWVDEGRFKGDNAVVYKIDFTDSTFAYNPNTAKNIVDVRGIVYKIDGGNTSIFTSLGTGSSLELYFLRPNPVAGQPPIEEQIPANLITISNGAFSTKSQNGASDRGEKTMLAILKIDGNEATRANIPRGLYGTDGEPGSRGKRGRSYYYAQPWQDNPNVSYLVNDSIAPYFYFEDDGEYYIYNPVGDVNDSISMRAMGTPSTSNPNWEIMQSKFKYLITEAIFGEFADFGDFIINGSWLFAEIGMFLGESTEDHPTHTHNIYDFRDVPEAEEVTMPVHAFLHPEDPTISFVNRYDDSESGYATVDDVTTEPKCVIVNSSQQEVWLPLQKGVLYSIQAFYENCRFYLRKEGSSTDLSLMGRQGETTGFTYFQVAEKGNYKFMVERYASGSSAKLSWVRFSEHYFLANIAINGKTGYILQRDSHGNYSGTGNFSYAYIDSSNINKIHSGTAYDESNPKWIDINGGTLDISRYSKVRVVEWKSGYVNPLGYVYVENGVLKVSSEEREFYNPNGNSTPAN